MDDPDCWKLAIFIGKNLTRTGAVRNPNKYHFVSNRFTAVYITESVYNLELLDSLKTVQI